ncbi:MAG TPA: winged helix DNA-binding domain-containing protein [Candidatus Saccharimonadales bacterium]|nr:winged helix DNA-binding domain-containing protein [Candidatus Saccharimonadales bacterium]
MSPTDIATLRLYSQHITQADFSTPEAVVSWMGAMQAQDYAGALWAIGLRSPHLTAVDIEKAIADRTIIRTWPMRGTLHFVAAKDARWMLHLLAPRIIARSATRRRQLGIDDDVITKSRQILEKTLAGSVVLTRTELCRILEEAGIPTGEQRGIWILHLLAEMGVLCFGPHEGRQPTFVLLEEWIPQVAELSKEESLATLASRYFTSHGPATLKDFAGWGQLPISEARLAINLADTTLTKSTVGNTDYWHPPNLPAVPSESTAFLLPGFDEFMLGYKDRSPALALEHSQKIIPGNNGMFMPTIVVNGQVAGTWKRTIRKNDVAVRLLPFEPLTSSTLQQIKLAATKYSNFIGIPVTIND